jgi:hypothetical protein
VEPSTAAGLDRDVNGHVILGTREGLGGIIGYIGRPITITQGTAVKDRCIRIGRPMAGVTIYMAKIHGEFNRQIQSSTSSHFRGS